MKQPSSLLIPVNERGVFSCKARCDQYTCNGYWILNGTIHKSLINEPRRTSTYLGNDNNEYTMTLTVNASEAMNNTRIQCQYVANGDNDGENHTATVQLLVISSKYERQIDSAYLSVFYDG